MLSRKYAKQTYKWQLELGMATIKQQHANIKQNYSCPEDNLLYCCNKRVPDKHYRKYVSLFFRLLHRLSPSSGVAVIVLDFCRPLCPVHYSLHLQPPHFPYLWCLPSCFLSPSESLSWYQCIYHPSLRMPFFPPPHMSVFSLWSSCHSCHFYCIPMCKLTKCSTVRKIIRCIT